MASPITIDGYRFSETDVRKTLFHALDLLDLYPPSIHAVQRPRRARITEALASGDPEHALRTIWPELLAAREDLVSTGALPTPQSGRVERISASDGGVPKRQIERAEVGWGGVVGDRQASRAHHGRPWQALCLWSSEVITGLAAAGHPIAAGNAGENVTISGLVWDDVRPGVQLRIGSVLCQIAAFAVPCTQNAKWFSDRDFTRIHHSHGPISRVYAVVLEPGVITTGDPADLEPVTPGAWHQM